MFNDGMNQKQLFSNNDSNTLYAEKDSDFRKIYNAVMQLLFRISFRVVNEEEVVKVEQAKKITIETIKHLSKNRVVVFGCGTGSPFFSTDTAAALRAAEVGAEAVLKATNVDGIYTKDPKKYDDAEKIDRITYMEVLKQKLNVMDTTATSLCIDNNIPIIVFDINEKGNLKKLIDGKKIGTLVEND